MTPFKPEVLHAMEACRDHAKDLHDASKMLREKGLANLAYHLATLALEELGKAQLIAMRSFGKPDSEPWYEKQLDDHVKKLFWALWGDVFGKRPDWKEIDSLRGTVTIIHNNRLRGLYVQTTASNFIAPKDAVTDEMLAPVINLVEAKLARQPSLIGVEYEQADLDLLSWFSLVSDDPEKRRFIFSSESFKKMEVLGAKEWLRWVKDEIERSAAEATAALQRELNRGFVEGEEGLQDKWEIKIRIFSQSHSIRARDLNKWNERMTWLKLFPVDKKKDQLDAILKIPRFVTVQMVYNVGFGFSQMLVAALNIASGGLFWWHQPRNLSHFYESLVDKENQMTGEIGRAPKLMIGWPNAALDSSILDQVVVVYAMMPQPTDQSRTEALTHYLAGIGLLAKTDVFLQFEPQAYGAFVAAASTILRLYHAELGEEFPVQIPELLAFLKLDDAFRQKHSNLLATYSAHTLKPGEITLSEVAEMKRLCDGLFMRAFSQMARTRSG